MKQTDEVDDLMNKTQKLAMVYQIVDKIVFDMIAGGSEQKYLVEIQSLLFEVLDRSELSLNHLIQERILLHYFLG